MSIGEQPFEINKIDSLISECEYAIEAEDLPNQDDDFDYENSESYRLCDLTRIEFETKHQLYSCEEYIYNSIPPENQRLYDPPSLLLESPVLLLPYATTDNRDVQINTSGLVPLRYLGVVIYPSNIIDDQVYFGPHMLGIFSLSYARNKSTKGILRPEAEYIAATPLRNSVVSDYQNAYLMN